MAETGVVGDEAQARVPVRAEGVGSLLRPAALKDAFERAYGGGVYVDLDVDARQEALAELDRLAEEATPGLVQRQIDAGLDVVTDGEMRRGFFVNSLLDAVSGIDLEGEPDDGEADPEAQRFVLPVVTEPVRKKANPALREARALSAITDFPKKVTFPAASYFYYKMVIDVSADAYPDRDAFIDDIVKVQRELVDEVIAAGVEHIQFDFPIYPMLVDESAEGQSAALGETAQSLLEKALAADAKMVADLPSHVTKAMHLCRGNEIRFFSGSVEPVAERLFNLPYDRFVVEWHDTDHDGTYDPIRFLPESKVIAMGLISTQSPELEDEDELLRRMEDAASFVDLSQLAIAPQCGFASTWHGHDYAEDVQWRKLELAGRVAERLWGAR